MKKLNSILLVDDEDIFIFLGSQIIKKMDCTQNVITFLRPTYVLDFLLHEKQQGNPWPDLMLVDINMPLMNGWKLIEELNTLRGKDDPGIVTYMLSSSLNPDDKTRANQTENINGFVSKPLNPDNLGIILYKHFLIQIGTSPLPTYHKAKQEAFFDSTGNNVQSVERIQKRGIQ